MWIKPKHDKDLRRMMISIPKWLRRSRFTAVLSTMRHPSEHFIGIKIECVRLIRKKDYCGQHAGPCPVNPIFARPHRHYHYLEGADWVGFNDGLNSVLDRLKIAADVWSYNRDSRQHRFFIRKGRCRQTEYYHEYAGRVVGWLSLDDGFRDYCGQKAPSSGFTDGTPGIPDWRPSAEKKREYKMLFERSR